MKVRIQNDGGPAYTTKITDAETGKALNYVTRVEITMDVSKVVQATLYMIDPVVDIIADAEIKLMCPCCGKEKELPAPVEDVQVSTIETPEREISVWEI